MTAFSVWNLHQFARERSILSATFHPSHLVMATVTTMTMTMMLLLMMMRGQYAAAEAAGSPRLAAGFGQPGLSLISRPASNEQESGVEVSSPPSAYPARASLGQEVTEGQWWGSSAAAAEIFDVSGWLRFSESSWAEAGRWSAVREGGLDQVVWFCWAVLGEKWNARIKSLVELKQVSTVKERAGASSACLSV